MPVTLHTYTHTHTQALQIREQYLQKAAVIYCCSARWHKKKVTFFSLKNKGRHVYRMLTKASFLWHDMYCVWFFLLTLLILDLGFFFLSKLQTEDTEVNGRNNIHDITTLPTSLALLLVPVRTEAGPFQQPSETHLTASSVLLPLNSCKKITLAF